MIIDNDPVVTRNISVPRDMSQLSCSSFTAGIVEAVLDGLGFVSFVCAFHIPVADSMYLACSRNCAQHSGR